MNAAFRVCTERDLLKLRGTQHSTVEHVIENKLPYAISWGSQIKNRFDFFQISAPMSIHAPNSPCVLRFVFVALASNI